MKKILPVLLIFFFTFLSCWQSSQSRKTLNEVIRPDKQVKAIIYEGNTGATDGYTYGVGIINANNSIVENEDVVFSGKDDRITVYWKSDEILVIRCLAPKFNIFYKVCIKGGIDIEYE